MSHVILASSVLYGNLISKSFSQFVLQKPHLIVEKLLSSSFPFFWNMYSALSTWLKIAFSEGSIPIAPYPVLFLLIASNSLGEETGDIGTVLASLLLFSNYSHHHYSTTSLLKYKASIYTTSILVLLLSSEF